MNEPKPQTKFTILIIFICARRRPCHDDDVDTIHWDRSFVAASPFEGNDAIWFPMSGIECVCLAEWMDINEWKWFFQRHTRTDNFRREYKMENANNRHYNLWPQLIEVNQTPAKIEFWWWQIIRTFEIDLYYSSTVHCSLGDSLTK